MPLKRLLLKWLLFKNNKKHLAENRARLVGYSFDLIASKILIDGQYEDKQLRILEQHLFNRLDQESVCLDIGANIGNHSIAFSDYFSEIHAFEPNSKIFELLKINARLKSNIKPWNTGLSDRKAEIEVIENQGNVGNTGIGLSVNKQHAGQTVIFNTMPLDDMDLDLFDRRISFVKIDVEGHELEVIKGAERTLKNMLPSLHWR